MWASKPLSSGYCFELMTFLSSQTSPGMPGTRSSTGCSVGEPTPPWVEGPGSARAEQEEWRRQRAPEWFNKVSELSCPCEMAATQTKPGLQGRYCKAELSKASAPTPAMKLLLRCSRTLLFCIVDNYMEKHFGAVFQGVSPEVTLESRGWEGRGAAF